MKNVHFPILKWGAMMSVEDGKRTKIGESEHKFQQVASCTHDHDHDWDQQSGIERFYNTD